MTKQIHSGIAAGQVPEGYKLEHGYVIPKEWKVVHFNECFHRLTRKNTENNQKVLTISAQQGLISQLDYYNTLYASEDKTGYFLLQKGNFAYNKSYSADYAYGAIKQLEKYDKGIVSPLYICFSANEGTNTDFYRQYFEAGMFNREIYKIAQEGARNHGLLNVSTPEFFSAALVFPPVDEQKKIAEILSCCDRVIELKQQFIAELQRLKSGFLQAMFPAKGHSEPVIRFSEFSDAWEQRKFADYYKMSSGYAFKMSDYCDDGVGLINGESIQHGIVNDDNLNHLPESFIEQYPEFVLKEGDIVVGLNRPITNGNLKIARIPSIYNNSLLYQRAGKIVYKAECDKDFSYTLLSQEILKHTLVEAVGSDQPFISTSKLDKWKIMMPMNIEEQEKIGVYFSNLDLLITLHQQELEETKKKKKSLAKLLLTGSVRVPT